MKNRMVIVGLIALVIAMIIIGFSIDIYIAKLIFEKTGVEFTWKTYLLYRFLRGGK